MECLMTSNPDILGAGTRIALYAHTTLECVFFYIGIVEFGLSLKAQNSNTQDFWYTRTDEDECTRKSVLTHFAVLFGLALSLFITLVVQAAKNSLTAPQAMVGLLELWLINGIIMLAYIHRFREKLYLRSVPAPAPPHTDTHTITWRDFLQGLGYWQVYLAAMGSFGIWLFAGLKQGRFGQQCGELFLFGASIDLSATGLDTFGLVLHSLLILPGFNVLLLAWLCALVAAPFLVLSQIPVVTSVPQGRPIRRTLGTTGVMSPYITSAIWIMPFLILATTIIQAIEGTSTISAGYSGGDDDDSWTAWQTLVLLSLGWPAYNTGRKVWRHILKVAEVGVRQASPGVDVSSHWTRWRMSLAPGSGT